RPDGTWELPARLRLDEIAGITGIRLPEDEDYDTLSGLVLDRLGRTAQEGDRVELVWRSRDEHGTPRVYRSRVEVLSVQRHVPETVALAAPDVDEDVDGGAEPHRTPSAEETR